MRHVKSIAVSTHSRGQQRGGDIVEGYCAEAAAAVEGFCEEARPAVLALAVRSRAFTDLAASFPALLFALATGYGTQKARRAATAAVDQGRSLKDAAAALGLPMWLRKLPAQAFRARLALLPSDPALVSRLQSLVPPQPAAAAAWMDRVLTAHHVAQATGRTELTLWVAQQYRAATPAATSDSFLRTLAWVWACGRPDLRLGELVGERWTPAMGSRRAAAAATLWRERLALDVVLGRGITDTWLAEGEARGFEFVALRTADQFIAEALAMDNCLDRYADRLAAGSVRIFSIRQDGVPVADVEIATHERELGMPAVTQLRGPRNRRAGMEVWQAVYAWLGAQEIRALPPADPVSLQPPERRRRVERLWQPFLAELPEHARFAFETTILPQRSARARRAAERRLLASSPP